MKIAWFHKTSTPEDRPEPITERLDRLEAGQRALLLEWEDSYERIARALARLNKRYRDNAAREARQEAAETHQDAPESTITPEDGLDPISRRILARRARVVPTRDNGGG